MLESLKAPETILVLLDQGRSKTLRSVLGSRQPREGRALREPRQHMNTIFKNTHTHTHTHTHIAFCTCFLLSIYLSIYLLYLSIPLSIRLSLCLSVYQI